MADWLNCRLRDGENPVPGEQSYMSTVPVHELFEQTDNLLIHIGQNVVGEGCPVDQVVWETLTLSAHLQH